MEREKPIRWLMQDLIVLTRHHGSTLDRHQNHQSVIYMHQAARLLNMREVKKVINWIG